MPILILQTTGAVADIVFGDGFSIDGEGEASSNTISGSFEWANVEGVAIPQGFTYGTIDESFSIFAVTSITPPVGIVEFDNFDVEAISRKKIVFESFTLDASVFENWEGVPSFDQMNVVSDIGAISGSVDFSISITSEASSSLQPGSINEIIFRSQVSGRSSTGISASLACDFSSSIQSRLLCESFASGYVDLGAISISADTSRVTSCQLASSFADQFLIESNGVASFGGSNIFCDFDFNASGMAIMEQIVLDKQIVLSNNETGNGYYYVDVV